MSARGDAALLSEAEYLFAVMGDRVTSHLIAEPTAWSASLAQMSSYSNPTPPLHKPGVDRRPYPQRHRHR
jgi:hypothetical protein